MKPGVNSYSTALRQCSAYWGRKTSRWPPWPLLPSIHALVWLPPVWAWLASNLIEYSIIKGISLLWLGYKIVTSVSLQLDSTAYVVCTENASYLLFRRCPFGPDQRKSGAEYWHNHVHPGEGFSSPPCRWDPSRGWHLDCSL